MPENFHGAAKAGRTSLSIPVKLLSTSTNDGVPGKVFSDVTVSYWRQGAAQVDVTPVTLAAITTAWTSGGFKEVDATKHKGLYRLDIPNAAVAAGADWVVITVNCTGCFQHDTCLPLEGAGSAEVAALVAAPRGATLGAL